jgi:hypothetical protein
MAKKHCSVCAGLCRGGFCTLLLDTVCHQQVLILCSGFWDAGSLCTFDQCCTVGLGSAGFVRHQTKVRCPGFTLLRLRGSGLMHS